MPSAVSKMSHNVAKAAATPEKQHQKDRKSISQQYVQTAEMRRKYRLSPRPKDLYTAVTVSPNQEKSNSKGIFINVANY